MSSAVIERKKEKKTGKELNSFKAVFPSRSANESFARMLTASFVSQLDPTVSELADLKTAVSEAVTNCIVHAYPDGVGEITLTGRYYGDGQVVITVKDRGRGMANVKEAMQPLYTTDREGERSGMGFTVMGAFCDRLRVSSRLGAGTSVTLTKRFARGE